MSNPPKPLMSRELAVSFASAGAMWTLRYVLPPSVVRRIPSAPTAAARSQWLADETEAATFAKYGENATTPAQRAQVQAECDASIPAQLAAAERLRWINTWTARGLFRLLRLCGFTTRELRVFLGLEFYEQRELLRRDPSLYTTCKPPNRSKHKRGSEHGNSIAKKESAVAAAIRDRHHAGQCAETIAEELDLHPSTVARIVSSSARPRARHRTLVADDQLDALERMQRKGATAEQIASTFGVSLQTAKALTGAA